MSEVQVETFCKNPLVDEELDEIVDKAKDYAIQHGKSHIVQINIVV